MPILLTVQQQQALDSSEVQPARVLDPRTGATYVLVPLNEYEEVLEVLEDEKSQRSAGEVALLNVARRTLAIEVDPKPIAPKPSEIWREENREAIQAYNEFVAEHGVFSTGLRGF